MIEVDILPEKNVIDEGFLDLIGREFAIHEKGLAEWLKNAADAVTLSESTHGRQAIVLRFTDGDRMRPAVFECIDFAGMTHGSLEKEFKPWGRLSRVEERPGCYGGYGIGGKFYMREMFESSYLITYSQGRVNIFGFDQNRHYGYADGYRNRPLPPQEALHLADMDDLAEIMGMKATVLSGRCGFSVFRGVGPKGVAGRIDVESLCEGVRNHPQAQRPLRSHRVSVIHNGVTRIPRLMPPSISRREGFRRPWVRKIPAELPRPGRVDGASIPLSKDQEPIGVLRLFLSDESLVRQGKMASLNRIDFFGKDGVFASYRIDELGVEVPHGESIFGACCLSPSEHFEEKLGKKTRDRLVDGPETNALLGWIGSQVILFSEMIGKRLSEEKSAPRTSKGKGAER